jgi:hypothetical protein
MLEFENERARITHDPSGGPRHLTVRFGAADGYPDDLRRLVAGTLDEKAEQLKAVVADHSRRVIALDFQSLLPGIPNDGRAEFESVASRVRPLKEAIERTILDYLDNSSVVNGVMAWWRKFDFSLSPMDRIFQPAIVTLYTQSRVDDLLDQTQWSEMLPVALR